MANAAGPSQPYGVQSKEASGKLRKTASATSVAMPFPTAENNQNRSVIDVWVRVLDYANSPWKFEDVEQVEAYIKSLCPWAQNMCFGILHAATTVDHNPRRFLTFIMPGIIELASKLAQMPILMDGLSTLNCGENKSLCLPKSCIASLLANAFLCTFPNRNSKAPDNAFANFPSINMNCLFAACESDAVNNVKKEKLKCLLQYFGTRLDLPDELAEMGDLTFTRVHLPANKKFNWALCAKPMRKFEMQPLEARLEDAKCIQVADCHANIGGGVLRNGCLQEEIRFVTCPELIVARLFTERLADTEALIIQGVQQYCNFQGYHTSFQHLGPLIESLPEHILVAIDALDFSKLEMGSTFQYDLFHTYRNHPLIPQAVTKKGIQNYLLSSPGLAQYLKAAILRELVKASAGFVCEVQGISPDLAVATGNWGGGALFKGDAYMKGVIQHLAASAAGRDLHYFPANDVKLVQTFEDYQFEGKSVGEVYSKLLKYAATKIEEDIRNCYLSNNDSP